MDYSIVHFDAESLRFFSLSVSGERRVRTPLPIKKMFLVGALCVSS